MSLIGNILWLIFGGFIAGMGYIIGGLLLCLTIVGIPFGMQSIRIGFANFAPFGKEISDAKRSGGCLGLVFDIIWVVLFGWEIALYALLTLFLSGLVSDYTLEGPSSVRTATIITSFPDQVSQALMVDLNRGVSEWQIKGSYTGKTHAMLACTIYRPQVTDLKRIVAKADPQAFVTIGVAHQAHGVGFMPLK